jgi:N4-gp56 family major capsid protein
MSVQTYTSTVQRIGKFAGKILAHAVCEEILAKLGSQIAMPKNVSDTIIFRRWLPYGATATNANTQNRFFVDGNGDRGNVIVQGHQTQEGVTPPPDSIVPLDITVTMQQYCCLYGYTDKTADLFEDDIPAQMKIQIGERVAFVNELKIYGELKAGTNQYYGGTGTSLATVNGPISLPLLRKIVKNLDANHGKPVNKMLSASDKYGTTPVRMGFAVYMHSDLSPDVRDLAGFEDASKYASGAPLPGELGKVEDFRFIKHPDLPPIQNGGAAVGATGLQATTANVDVYPMLILAMDCFGQVALRGESALQPTFLPTGHKDKADVFGQRGYAGTMWWKAIVRQNEGWMATLNVGIRLI